MATAKPKKHHFVPRLLLKNFCSGTKENIFVLDKQTQNKYQASIYDAAAEKYFYEYSDKSFNIDTEEKLSLLEGRCGEIFKKIIETETLVNIDDAERKLLCLFTAIQTLRTNNQREKLGQINKTMSNAFRTMGIDPNHDINNFRELSKEDVKNASIINMLALGEEVARHFIDKELSLVKAPTDSEFYISDHPVTLYNYFPRHGRGNIGVALDGIEIHFPITPKLCLNFLCRKTLSQVRNRVQHVKLLKSQGLVIPINIADAEKYLNQFDHKECRELQPENIEFHNSLQVSQSIRFLYSKSGNFELAFDIFKSNPEIKNPPDFTGQYKAKTSED